MVANTDKSTSANVAGLLGAMLHQLRATETIEDCIDRLRACYAAFEIDEFVLFPDNLTHIPIVASDNAAARNAEKHLQSIRLALHSTPQSCDELPQFPMTMPDFLDQTGLCPAGQGGRELAKSYNMEDGHVLPLRGNGQKALLVILNRIESTELARLLALQAISASTIHHIDRLGKQREQAVTIALSPLEHTFLEGMASGRKKDDIAAEHGLSPHTMSVFSGQIARKLGANTIGEAISMTSKAAVQ